jgi:20S proteasome alpha/beta subunit
MSTVAGVEVKNSKKLVNVDSLGDYVRAYATVTGTTPSITASVNFLGSE